MLKVLGTISIILASIAVAPNLYSHIRSYLDFSEAESRIADAVVNKRTVLELNDLKHLTSIPEDVKHIQGLWFVSASQTRLSDIEALAGLPSLRTLQLAETRVTDLSPLAGSSSIETLDLGRSWAFDLEPLSSLPRLRWLQMDRLSVKSLCPLMKNMFLKWLNLYRSYAEDGSQNCFKTLERRVDDLGGGNSYKQNYIPGGAYKSKIAFQRFLEDWEWR